MVQQAEPHPAPPAPSSRPDPAANRPPAAPPAKPNGKPLVAPPPSEATATCTVGSEPKPSPPTNPRTCAGAASSRSAPTPRCSTSATPTTGSAGWASNTQHAHEVTDSPWGRGEGRRRKRGHIGRPRVLERVSCRRSRPQGVWRCRGRPRSRTSGGKVAVSGRAPSGPALVLWRCPVANLIHLRRRAGC
jgi:hypothetical protein